MPDDKQKTAAPKPAESDSLDSTNNPPASSEAAAEQPREKTSLIKRLPLFNNLYLVVFVLLVLAAGAVVYVSIKSAKPSTTTTKLGSLTDQQLTALKGNTTQVGDSKQTLDIQSNSIFENQVLLRSDLNVAGSIKIGGTLSIPAINVGGSGTFGQLGTNGGLNVGGDTTLQGQLAVQKNLTVTGTASFGGLNVSSLTVTTLGLRGDLNLNEHINATGGNPGRTNGTALGSGGTASVGGSDTAGSVAINTGSSPPAGCFINITFAKKFNDTPHVIISPSNSSAAALQYYTNRSSTGFSICTASVPAASSNYTFDYVVIN